MNIESAAQTGLEENDDAISKRIRDELLNLGIMECPKEMADRLLIIEKNSKFNNDSRMICEGFQNVLDKMMETSYAMKNSLTAKQRQEGELAAFLHDIGKSGAAEADLRGQVSVIKLFSADQFTYPIDPNKTVSDAISECFPEEYDEMMKNLAQSGVDKEMTMRQFYDKHAEWTHDILEKFPETVTKRTRLVAGSHHMDRGVNPCHLSENEVPMESFLIGVLENYVDVLEEKILMVVDKYQASISRGHSTHEKAVEIVRKIFSEKYSGDPIINLIINTIDELGKKDAIFPKTKDRYLSLRNIVRTTH
jgi:hypothetical protein